MPTNRVPPQATISGSGNMFLYAPLPRLISFVPKNGNLKSWRNASYLTHFPETRKSEMRISKPETNSKEPNANHQKERTTGRSRFDLSFGHLNLILFRISIFEFSRPLELPKSRTGLMRRRTMLYALRPRPFSDDRIALTGSFALSARLCPRRS